MPDKPSHTLNTLKRSLYENCTVLNKNGLTIFRCSVKRGQWYLNRGLANALATNPLTIQLNFDTNGDGNAGDAFYMQNRSNICVVCGTEEHLTRHHVVPWSFRRFFPREKKDHSYHDILLLCKSHHEEYEEHASKLKRILQEEYNIPMDGIVDSEEEKDYVKNYYLCCDYVHALKNHGDKIPDNRKIVLEAKIKFLLNKYSFDMNDIVDRKKKHYSVTTQGEIIVSKLTDINAFVIRWRKHFIDIMKPSFLPKYWSIYRTER